MFTHDPAVPPPLRGLLAPTGKPHRVALSPPCTWVAHTGPGRAPASLLRVQFSAELSNQRRGARSIALRPEPGPPLAAAPTWNLQLISIAPWAAWGQMVPEATEKPNTMPGWSRAWPTPTPFLGGPALLQTALGTTVPAWIKGIKHHSTPVLLQLQSAQPGLPPGLLPLLGGQALPSDPVPTKGPLSMTKRPQRLPPTNGIRPAGALSETATRACPCFSPFLPNGPTRSSRCHINYLNLGDMRAASSETPFRARRPRIPH